MEQWPSGQGDGLPLLGYLVQDHQVAQKVKSTLKLTAAFSNTLNKSISEFLVKLTRNCAWN